MFSRGAFSFHSARLPASPENSLTPIIPARLSRAPLERDARPSRKSNYSRTYEIPGGGGCTGFLVRPIRRVSKPFVSPTYQISARNSFVSPTYAKTGEWSPCGKCRRADIFDFSPYIFRFLGRLLGQCLLNGSHTPEILPGFRQRVDRIVIFVAGSKRHFSKSLPAVPVLRIPRIFSLGELRPNLVFSAEGNHEEKTDVDGDRRYSGGGSSASSPKRESAGRRQIAGRGDAGAGFHAEFAGRKTHQPA